MSSDRVAPMSRRCSICAEPAKSDWVARRALEGHSANKIETLSRMSNAPGVMKRETVKKHNDICMNQDGISSATVGAAASSFTSVTPMSATEDVAVLVQKEVVQKLREGEARVTVQHGLQAQQLLDRRSERAKDRELSIQLARLLHTGAPPPTAIEERPVVIEGEVAEVV